MSTAEAEASPWIGMHAASGGIQRLGFERGESIQLRASGERSAPPVSDSTAASVDGMRGSGEPLPAEARAFFEPRFGVDFGHVRIHVDGRASRVARELNARAFTSGRDVYFGAGEYSLGSERGERLMAHELTHVVQQSGGRCSSGTIQRQPATPTAEEIFLVKLPAGGMHLKVEPYPNADNFPGDKVENGDVVVVRNTGGAATYRNVKNGTWSWIEVPGKSSPDSKYPVLHGFIPNTHIAGMTIGPVTEEEVEPPPAEPSQPQIPDVCPDRPVDDSKVKAYISDAQSHASVSGGWDVEKAFQYLQAKRCVAKYCCDVDLAAAEHYMFSRYMVFVEGYSLPVWMGLVLGYAGAKGLGLMPSLCQCPVTPTSGAQIDWALQGAVDGEYDGFVGSPPAAR